MENKSSGKGKTVMKAGIAYTVGDIIIKGFAFLTIPLFTRLMSPDQFGLYTTFFTYENLLMIILGMSLYLSVKAANLEFPGKVDEYISNLFLLILPVTLVLIGASFLFGKGLEGALGYPPYMLAVMAIISFSNTMVSIYNERVSLEYQYKKYLLVSGVNTFGSAIIGFFLILFVTKTETYIGRTLGLAVIYFISAAAITAGIIRKARPKFNKKYTSFALKFSLPLIPQAFFQIILAQYGKIAVQNLAGKTEAGIYGFAFSMIQILQVIIVAANSVYTPWFFENYKEGNIGAIRARSVQFIILFGFITVGFMGLSPEVIKIMADREYHECIKIIVPAAIGIFFYFMYQIPLQAGYCRKKTGVVAAVTVGAGIFNVILCNLFVEKWSYPAAVYVTTATYILCFILYSVMSKVLLGKLPFDLRKIILVTAVVTAAGIAIQSSLDSLIIRISVIILSLPLLILCDSNIIKEVRLILKGRKKDE